MNLQVMPKDALVEWIELLSARYRVIGPKRKQEVVQQQPAGDTQQPPREQYIFGELQGAHELELSYPSTILPPKKVFLPQKEELFSFKDNGHQVDLQLDERRTVIFGIHTCDLHAVLLLDQAFSQGAADQHYMARRANTTMVSIECLDPCSESAFCKDMGTWIVPETFDLHLTDLGHEYALEIGSAKGSELLENLTNIRPATETDYWRFNQAISAKWARFPYRLEADLSELPSLLAISYRSQVWEELGQQCLGCGTCTAVCPTCYCFDVVDEVNFDLASGKRFRVWDSCQFGQFASVAGGHDFRNSRAARLRHRFYHKFKYQAENSGLVGCVGCGRCAEACLVNIKPIDVINKLHRKRVAVSGERQEVME